MMPTKEDVAFNSGYEAAMGAIESLTNRALQLRHALQQIEEIADGREDLTESGGPNVWMQILTIARGAI